MWHLLGPLKDALRGRRRAQVAKAGRGLGRALAMQFARAGAHVVCWDKDMEASMETVYEIRQRGGEAVGFRCDLSNASDVISTAADVMHVVGHIDILVNNAGTYPSKPLLAWDERELRQLFDVNMFPHFWMLNAILPYMLRRNKGHIVAISSTSALSPLPHEVPYAATKFAVSGLMEALLQEVRLTSGSKVRATCVYPHYSPSEGARPLHLKFRMTPRTVEEVALEIVKGVRQGREAFSVPQNMFFYMNFLRCFPQEVRTFWKTFLYTKAPVEEELCEIVDGRQSQGEVARVTVSQHGDEATPRTLNVAKGPQLKPIGSMSGDTGPPAKKRDINWRIEIPEPSTNFMTGSKWKVSPPETFGYNFSDRDIELANFPSASHQYSSNNGSLLYLTDSTKTVDTSPTPDSCDSEQEISEPSWLVRLTESLIHNDWRRKLHAPPSKFVLPASPNYLDHVEQTSSNFTARDYISVPPVAFITKDEQEFPSQIIQMISSCKQEECGAYPGGSKDLDEPTVRTGLSQHNNLLLTSSSILVIDAPPRINILPELQTNLSPMIPTEVLHNSYGAEIQPRPHNDKSDLSVSLDAKETTCRSVKQDVNYVKSHLMGTVRDIPNVELIADFHSSPYLSAVDIIQDMQILEQAECLAHVGLPKYQNSKAITVTEETTDQHEENIKSQTRKTTYEVVSSPQLYTTSRKSNTDINEKAHILDDVHIEFESMLIQLGMTERFNSPRMYDSDQLNDYQLDIHRSLKYTETTEMIYKWPTITTPRNTLDNRDDFRMIQHNAIQYEEGIKVSSENQHAALATEFPAPSCNSAVDILMGTLILEQANPQFEPLLRKRRMTKHYDSNDHLEERLDGSQITSCESYKGSDIIEIHVRRHGEDSSDVMLTPDLLATPNNSVTNIVRELPEVTHPLLESSMRHSQSPESSDTNNCQDNGP